MQLLPRGALAFFFPRQGAFDTAGMDRETEFGADRLSKRTGGRWMLVHHLRLDERHHLGGELVRAAGSAPLRQQPGKPLLREGRLGLVVGRTGEAKELGRLGLLCSLGAHVAQHLVFDLHEIAGIEEAVRLEPGRLHPLRVSVQRTLPVEELRFGVALGQRNYRAPEYVILYTPP